jgi:hypothetical protein
MNEEKLFLPHGDTEFWSAFVNWLSRPAPPTGAVQPAVAQCSNLPTLCPHLAETRVTERLPPSAATPMIPGLPHRAPLFLEGLIAFEPHGAHCSADPAPSRPWSQRKLNQYVLHS